MRLGVSFGHGGLDLGTTAGMEWGITEAPYVRCLGEELCSRLPDGWLSVVRLNAIHETVCVADRAQRARAASCDLVLALHVNELLGSNAHGCHMFYRDESPLALQVSLHMARAWPMPFRRSLRGHRLPGVGYIAGMVEPARADLWPRASALLATYAPIPTVLVEAFYASSCTDCQAAVEEHVQLGMVAAMLGGISVAGEAWSRSAVV